MKTAIVTGATSGFGAATARGLAKLGWQVVITGRRADRLETLAAELTGMAAVHTLCFDISDVRQIETALASLPPTFSNIDLLVNNAGLALGTGPAQTSSMSDWQTMIDTNVTGLVAMTKSLLPSLIRQRGAIVNLSSIAANWPYPGGNVYAATKAFVRQFSLGLRSDLQGTGVRVTSIEPGLSESEFTLVRTAGDRAAYDKLYAGAHPLQPEDIAQTICWIAQLPAHVNVNTLEMMPTSQSWSPFAISRDGAM